MQRFRFVMWMVCAVAACGMASRSSAMAGTAGLDPPSEPDTGSSVGGAPAATSGSGSTFSFVAFGDNDCDCDAQKAVADQMDAWHVDHPFQAAVLLGDSLIGCSMDRLRDSFDRYYGGLAEKGVCFCAAVGNHDLGNCPPAAAQTIRQRIGVRGGENGYDVFIPDARVDGRPLVVFFVLNTDRMAGRRSDPKQIEWLREKARATDAVWKIALTHHPLLTPRSRHGVEKGLADALLPVFQENGIALVLSGHNHFYARMKPKSGVVQFISGGGGRNLDGFKPDAMTEKAAKEYHFLSMEVHPDRIDFRAVSSTGDIIDEGRIER